MSSDHTGMPPFPSSVPPPAHPPRTGWLHWLARLSMGALLFEIVSGLAITIAPFRPTVQWGVLLHTVAGAALLLPVAWYCVRHIAEYRTYAWSHITVLGWAAVLGLAVACVSGVVLTLQALAGMRTEPLWRTVHLVSTLVMLAGVVPHVLTVVLKQRRTETF